MKAAGLQKEAEMAADGVANLEMEDKAEDREEMEDRVNGAVEV
jgi:hypothetical protein